MPRRSTTVSDVSVDVLVHDLDRSVRGARGGPDGLVAQSRPFSDSLIGDPCPHNPQVHHTPVLSSPTQHIPQSSLTPRPSHPLSSHQAPPTPHLHDGHFRDKLDISPEIKQTRKDLLREAFFPDWKDDASSADLGNPDEMQRKDPLGTQIWKLYSKTKTQLPNQERMENLTWRMMAMNLKRKEREQARYAPTPLLILCARSNKIQTDERIFPGPVN